MTFFFFFFAHAAVACGLRPLYPRVLPGHIGIRECVPPRGLVSGIWPMIISWPMGHVSINQSNFYRLGGATTVSVFNKKKKKPSSVTLGIFPKRTKHT